MEINRNLRQKDSAIRNPNSGFHIELIAMKDFITITK